MDEAANALTPEDRAGRRGTARARFDHQLAQLSPGGYLFEVLKRAGAGVYTVGFMHAGNLAYLALMAVFPFFIVAAAILSVLDANDRIQMAVASFLHVLPPNVADILRTPIHDVLTARTGSLLWLGALVGLWTVGSFVETIREIFRQAYGTQSTQPLWRARLGLSLGIVLSVVLALISFLVQGLLTAAEQFIYRLIPWAQDVAGWIGISRAIPAVVMFGALFMLFYFVTPSKYRYSGSRKWPGALFTTIWWIGMTAGLPLVLAQLGGYSLTYGSLAGVVVTLLFFYLIGLGLVFGAHLNAALAEPPETGLEGAQTELKEKAGP
ncbi:YihY/virulence factor BrkB family protein [uncultured Sphingomonas sp.]|uniref:YihY/virulence factor BrkB family protein n=1 Tax=uncultured Sphingomonas sp. TaxID=158754 RepID=UPI0026042697|nr:YihY/virulence factor BrkB family protein [uncultured Sphingomonas sp.]